jgi:organic hydroperoxide reductase OsmC/OhrA
VTPSPHRYTARLDWTGSAAGGTRHYAEYSRNYAVAFDGKPTLEGSADAGFRGDPTRHDPEQHFLAAITGCHMLSYLALAARAGVVVTAYHDEAVGVLEFDGRGGGRFTSVSLHPTVTVAPGSDVARAAALHDEAHRTCFIAASCAVPIRHAATVVVAPD